VLLVFECPVPDAIFNVFVVNVGKCLRASFSQSQVKTTIQLPLHKKPRMGKATAAPAGAPVGLGERAPESWCLACWLSLCRQGPGNSFKDSGCPGWAELLVSTTLLVPCGLLSFWAFPENSF
jgi:hypothetical protein